MRRHVQRLSRQTLFASPSNISPRLLVYHPGCSTKRLFPSLLSIRTSPYVTDNNLGKDSVGAKRGGRRSTVKFGDLPQGLIIAKDGPDAPPEEPMAHGGGYPAVIQQAWDNMIKFPKCVVLTRVGGFYELYFHQAEQWGSQLNLKVAKKKTSAGPVSMMGFPQMQLERYLKVLVQDYGVHVAIAEEIANDPSQRIKSAGLLFDRQVKRIITPGTLIDEKFISPNEHNYLLGVCSKDALNVSIPVDPAQPATEQDALISLPLQLAWIDMSSGDFLVQSTDASSLASDVSRIAPTEIVVQKALYGMMNDKRLGLSSAHLEKMTFLDIELSICGTESIASAVEERESSSFASLSQGDVLCSNMLVGYIRDQLPGLRLRLQPPQSYHSERHMGIDKNTLRGLEITKTLKDGTALGSLLHSVRRTSTRSGARLLSERLVSPSTSLNVILERLDLVQELISKPQLITEVCALLGRTTDSLRLLQAIALGKGDAQDLLSLSSTIALTRKIGDVLEMYAEKGAPLRVILGKFYWTETQKVAERIRNAIDEEGLMSRYRLKASEAAEAAAMAQEAIAAEDANDMAALHQRLGSVKRAKSSSDLDDGEEDAFAADEIWIMRRNASSNLRELHDRLVRLRQQEKDLTSELQKKLGAKSLALKFSPNLGHFVYVKGRDAKSDPASVIEEARPAGSSKSTRSFYLASWTTLGKSIETAKLRIRAEEQQIFKALRNEVCDNIVPLRRNAGVLDELDVACSNALLAKECNLVRPIFDADIGLHIVGGRHMTVEAGLRTQGRTFTSNDTVIGQFNSDKEGNQVASAETCTNSTSADQKSIHLITGPNMAGKSTYLRQIALISILAQTGSYVPASYARLGIVDAVFSRIGSADNLYQDQSTFMVEMLETAEILRNATSRSLVVMDEVGRGTSPEDGVAVGFAVLETLRRRNVGRVFFATHFHKIIDMCQNWPEVHCSCTRIVEDRGLEGAGFRFDHKMRPGVNRDSHALKVATLAGLPNETIRIAADALAGLKQT